MPALIIEAGIYFYSYSYRAILGGIVRQWREDKKPFPLRVLPFFKGKIN